MDVVSSLLGLSGADTHQKPPPKPRSLITQAVGQWTQTLEPSSSQTTAISKKLIPSEIYSRTIAIPLSLFECLFSHQQPGSKTISILVETSSGTLLALNAERAGASFTLRAGPLFNALKARAGDSLCLTPVDNDDPHASNEAPPRVSAALLSNEATAAVTDAVSPSLQEGGEPCVAVSSSPEYNIAASTCKTQRPAVSTPDDVEFRGPPTRNNTDVRAITAAASGFYSSEDYESPSLHNAVEKGHNEEEYKEEYNDNNDDDDVNAQRSTEAAAMLAMALADDPDWSNAGDGGRAHRSRGRPRKRKPNSAYSDSIYTMDAPLSPVKHGAVNSTRYHARRITHRGSQLNANLQCAHCGTRDTPRWWKETFPQGTLCNACGIWLKRHGYPRPVQFFAGSVGGNPLPATDGGHGTAMVAGGAGGPTYQSHHHGGAGNTAAAPAPGDFYLINGRPKRRRHAAPLPHIIRSTGSADFIGIKPLHSTPIGSFADGGTSNNGSSALYGSDGKMEGEGGSGGGDDAAGGGMERRSRGDDDDGDDDGDMKDDCTETIPPVKFESAGKKVFILRRKMLYGDTNREGGETQGAPSSGGSQNQHTAALVHFGWAPTARAAHEMYDKVAAYAAQSTLISVEDFEILGETRATATLTLRRDGGGVEDWDAVVSDFAGAL